MYPFQMPKPPQLARFNAEEQQFCFDLILNHGTLTYTKGQIQTLCGERSFQPLVFLIASFQSLTVAQDLSWGLDHRLFGQLRALPFGLLYQGNTLSTADKDLINRFSSEQDRYLDSFSFRQRLDPDPDGALHKNNHRKPKGSLFSSGSLYPQLIWVLHTQSYDLKTPTKSHLQ